jgi:broad specificity phosphatase PhoE
MEKPSACTVFLIRHGETEWNAAGRWQGHADVPLSATGREQAARLARRLAQEGICFDALYSSDLSRARETAEALGGALGLRPVSSPALREIDLGAWSGKTRAEIAAVFPDQWRMLQRDEDFARGGGETFHALQKRAGDWMLRTAEKHPGETILTVTHGGWIRAVLLEALGLTWAGRNRIPPIGNGAVSILEHEAGGDWRIVRMNGAAEEAIKRSPAERNEGDPAE